MTNSIASEPSSLDTSVMLPIDLSGKRAIICGVGDDVGFGWAIAKSLAEAGASVCVAGWPPALGVFETMLRRGKFDASRKLSDGRLLEFEHIRCVYRHVQEHRR